MKNIRMIAATALILCLCGCAAKPEITATPTVSAVSATPVIESEETPPPTEVIQGTPMTPAVNQTPTIQQTESTVQPTVKVTKTKPNTTKPVIVTHKPTATKRNTMKPVVSPTKVPKNTPKSTSKATAKPTKTAKAEKPFDINYWIGFAKDYAESVGLVLNPEAIYCWDNPTNANARCRFLERDLSGLLNRYAKDKDITDVWIWSEDLGGGEYLIYIGYA